MQKHVTRQNVLAVLGVFFLLFAVASAHTHTQLTILSADKALCGSQYRAQALLEYDAGWHDAPLANATVTFDLGNGYSATAVTDDEGIAAVDLQIPGSVDLLTVNYDGDRTYAGTSASTSHFHVLPDAPSEVIASPSSVCDGGGRVVLSAQGCVGEGTWKWYSSPSCNSLSYLGSGSSLTIQHIPTVTTTYYVRGELSGQPSSEVASVTVTVGHLPPVVTIPDDMSVRNDDGVCGAYVTFDVKAISNCYGTLAPEVVPPSGSLFPTGTTVVTVTAVDPEQRATEARFSVTVIDSETPMFEIPANIAVFNEPGLPSAVVTFDVSGSDNCDGEVTPIVEPPSGSAFRAGVNTVNVRAMDEAGNLGTASFLVTVIDKEAPLLTVPDNITVFNDPGVCGAVVNFDVVATDIADGELAPVVEPPSGSVFPVGTIIVRVSATDAAHNSSNASFLVLVKDKEAPVITVPDEIVVSTDPGMGSAVVHFDVSAYDNCNEAVTASALPPSGATFPVGLSQVKVTATDVVSNDAETSFYVAVFDPEHPLIVAPYPITECIDPGATYLVRELPLPAMRDNYRIVSVTNDAPAGNIFLLGETVVTWTVSDEKGNTVTATQLVTVRQRPSSLVRLVGEPSILEGQSTLIRADLTGAGPWTVTWSDGLKETVDASPRMRMITGPAGTTTFSILALKDANCAANTTDMKGSATVTVAPSAYIELYSSVHIVTPGATSTLSVLALPLELFKVYDIAVVPRTAVLATALASDKGVVRMDVLSGPMEVDWQGGKAAFYKVQLPANMGLMLIGKALIGENLVYVGCPIDALAPNTTSTATVTYLFEPLDVNEHATLPSAPVLYQNYPDPFSYSTAIGFAVPEYTTVTMKVFDRLGREVATLADGKTFDAGYHRISLQAGGLPTGSYFCRMTAGTTTVTRQMNLVK